jgi:O-antigen/teichoic acid export membrane protein
LVFYFYLLIYSYLYKFIENYGIIAFYSTLSAFIAVADGGLTATLSREFAGKGFKDPYYARSLLYTIERIYIIILLFVVCLIFFFSDFIVQTWLISDKIPYQDLLLYVRLMGVIVALQLFTTLHQGGLIGLQKQVLSNTLYILYSIARSALVIIILLLGGGLLGYFVWQLICSIIYLFFLIYYLKSSIPLKLKASVDFSLFSDIWKYSLGMMYISVLTALSTQVDKLTIANYLSLKSLGEYSLAASLGQIAYIISYPIMIAIFPELTKNIVENQKGNAIKMFHRYAFFISCIASTSTLVIFINAYDIILIWTSNVEIANSVNKPLRLLLIGGMFLALQLIPYYWALANKHTRANIIVDTILVLTLILCLPYFISIYGLNGAAIIWMALNFLSFIFLSALVFSKYMPIKDIKRWIVIDLLVPISIAIILCIAIYFLTFDISHHYWTIIYTFIGSLIILLFDFWVYKKYICNYGTRESVVVNSYCN